MADETVGIKVVADTANAEAGFRKIKKEVDGVATATRKLSEESGLTLKKVRDAVTPINQSLELMNKGLRVVKLGWNFAKEGAEFQAFASRVNQALVDKVQRAVNGTVDRLTIMREITKKGADQAIADLTRQANALGETGRAIAQTEAQMVDFWNVVKVGASDALGFVLRLKHEIENLDPRGSTGNRNELLAAQEASTELGGRIGSGAILDVVKGRLRGDPTRDRQIKEAYERAIRRQQALAPIGSGPGGAADPWTPNFVKNYRPGGGGGSKGDDDVRIRGGMYSVGGGTANVGSNPLDIYGSSSFSGGLIGGQAGSPSAASNYGSRSGLYSPGKNLGVNTSELDALRQQYAQVNQAALQAQDITVNAIGAGIDAAIGGQEKMSKAALRAVATQLRGKAVMWGMEAVAAGIFGNFAGAAKLGALAVAAGVAASQMGGGGGSPGGGVASIPGGGYAGISSGPVSNTFNVYGGSGGMNAQAFADQYRTAQRQGLIPNGSGPSRITS